MSKYWFYIENYVHVSTAYPDKVFIYNTLDYSRLIYENSNVYSFMSDLNSSLNNGVIEVDMKSLYDEKRELYDFIMDVREKYMGDLLPVAADRECKKPVLFRSVPVILREGAGSKEEKLGENILYNLTHLTLYINEECQYDCGDCNGYYKQFICCHRTVDKKELPFEVVLKLLEEVQETSLIKINIVGGNIFGYTHFHELVEKLNSCSIKKEYKINVKHLSDLAIFKGIVENPTNSIEIICNNVKDLEDASLIKELGYISSLRLNMIAQSDEDIEGYEKLLSASLQQVTFSPFYNSRNIKFFEENVFITKEDIESLNLKDMEIKRNYLLNNHFFGHLICMPDGNVYSSLNDESLGKITEKGIGELMLKELMERNNWLGVRFKKSPCDNCVFSCLCPPVSEYEKVIGLNNLCMLK